jgi:hypothetical protein
LSYDNRRHQLPHPAEGCRKEGDLFCSHKYAGKSALRFELEVDILAGNLVWVEGPYPASTWPDVVFFNSVLSHYLEPGKRVNAHKGYVGHPDKIKCPHNGCNPAENVGMQSLARSCHETLNGCLKNWGILKKTHRHDIKQHWMVFMHVR